MSDNEFSDSGYGHGGRMEDDEDFAFDDDGMGGNGGRPLMNSRMVTNQPFDEAVEVEGSDVGTDRDSQRGDSAPQTPDPDTMGGGGAAGYGSRDDGGFGGDPRTPAKQGTGTMGGGFLNTESGLPDDAHTPKKLGEYEPQDFEHLQVSDELRELFSWIPKYEPVIYDVPAPFRPFIPEYLPSVGNVDGFLKVPRPDGKPESLGLTLVDEPAARQSDPSVLHMKLRSKMKKAGLKEADVRAVGEEDDQGKAITQWVADLDTLHKDQAAPSVHYSRPYPSIESLMEAWSPQFEEALNGLKLPPADIDLSLEQFAKVALTLTDIPYPKEGEGSVIEPLHLLFSLYSEFKNNEYFNRVGMGMGGDPDSDAGDGNIMKL